MRDLATHPDLAGSARLAPGERERAVLTDSRSNGAMPNPVRLTRYSGRERRARGRDQASSGPAMAKTPCHDDPDATPCRMTTTWIIPVQPGSRLHIALR